VRRRLSLETSVREFLESGDPADEIVRAARDWAADLIVMSSRWRGSVEHVLFGKIAAAVLELARCPVLMVPPKT
jgi:nucleotide-binding universal stress UspA family protein